MNKRIKAVSLVFFLIPLPTLIAQNATQVLGDEKIVSSIAINIQTTESQCHVEDLRCRMDILESQNRTLQKTLERLIQQNNELAKALLSARGEPIVAVNTNGSESPQSGGLSSENTSPKEVISNSRYRSLASQRAQQDPPASKISPLEASHKAAQNLNLELNSRRKYTQEDLKKDATELLSILNPQPSSYKTRIERLEAIQRAFGNPNLSEENYRRLMDEQKRLEAEPMHSSEPGVGASFNKDNGDPVNLRPEPKDLLNDK